MCVTTFCHSFLVVENLYTYTLIHIHIDTHTPHTSALPIHISHLPTHTDTKVLAFMLFLFAIFLILFFRLLFRNVNWCGDEATARKKGYEKKGVKTLLKNCAHWNVFANYYFFSFSMTLLTRYQFHLCYIFYFLYVWLIQMVKYVVVDIVLYYGWIRVKWVFEVIKLVFWIRLFSRFRTVGTSLFNTLSKCKDFFFFVLLCSILEEEV